MQKVGLMGIAVVCASLAVACAAPTAQAPRTADSENSSAAVNARLAALEARVATLEAQRVAVGSAQAARPHPRVRHNRPDPDTVYSVPITGDPFIGPRYAPVTIVEAFDFACPYCNRARSTIAALQAKYGSDLKVVYKPFVVHRAVAYPPAYAACAAERQGKFKEMHEAIWDKGYASGARKLSAAHMEELATSLGLDMAKFRADATGDGCHEAVADDMTLLSGLGVSGTPTFFINGRPIIGAQPMAMFATVIDQELAKARASSIPVKDYYEHLVESGARSIHE